MRLASLASVLAVVVALFPHWFFRLPDARLGVAVLFLLVSASLLLKAMQLPSVAEVAERLTPVAAAVQQPAQSRSVASRHAKWGQPDRGAVGDRAGVDVTEDAYMQGPVTMHPVTMEFSSMAMERRYRAAVFASSHGIHQVIPVVIAALGYAACTMEQDGRPGGGRTLAHAWWSGPAFFPWASGEGDTPDGNGQGGRGCLFYSWVLPAHVAWMLLRWAASKLQDQGKAQSIFSYVVQTVCMAATIGASGRLLCAPSPSTFLARHGLRLACTQPSGPGTPSSAASLQLALILAIYFMHAVGIAFYSRCLSAAALLASAAASAAVTSSAAEEAEMSLKAVAVVISSLLLRLHEKQQRELFMQVSQAKRLHILRLAADSRLSHLLKNRAASARFLCEKLALDWPDMPANARETIEQLGEQNRQMINWSHLHDMVLQLQAGTYVTSPSCAVVTDLLRACLPADFAIDGSACPNVLVFDEQITRIMLEEADSNAVKYGEPGASRCRITFGPDPHATHSTRSKAGRGPKSQPPSPLAARLLASRGSASRPHDLFLYITLSSQHPAATAQLEPATLPFGSSSRGLDRMFAERSAEMQTAPVVVRRRPSCASPSPSGTPSIGRITPRSFPVPSDMIPANTCGALPHGSTGPPSFCPSRDSREAPIAAPGTPHSESNSAVDSSAATSVAVSLYVARGGPGGPWAPSAFFQQPPTVVHGRSPDLPPAGSSRLSPHTRAPDGCQSSTLGPGSGMSARCVLGSSSGHSAHRAANAEAAREAVRAVEGRRAAADPGAADGGARAGGAGAARAGGAGSYPFPARGGGLGLSTVTRAAAAAAGGEAWLTSHTSGPHSSVTTAFHVLVPASLPANSQSNSPGLLERALDQGLGLRSSSKGEALWAMGSQPKPGGSPAAQAPTAPACPPDPLFIKSRPSVFAKPAPPLRALPPSQTPLADGAPSAGLAAPADLPRDPATTGVGVSRRGSTPELSVAESVGRAALEKLVRADCSIPGSSDAGKQVSVRPLAVETGGLGSGSAILFSAAAADTRGLGTTLRAPTPAPAPEAPKMARIGSLLASGAPSHRSASPLAPRQDTSPSAGTSSPLLGGNSTSISACAFSEWGAPPSEASPVAPAARSIFPSGEWGYSACSVASNVDWPTPSQTSAVGTTGGMADGPTLPSNKDSGSLDDDHPQAGPGAEGEWDGSEPVWTEELVIYGVDDSALMRTMLDTLSTSVLGCRPDRCGMLGATMCEVDAFIDIAMGKAAARPGMAPLAAHLVIVDQHLTFDHGADEEVEMLGTNLVEELHELGFAGVVCIHSGALDYARLVQLPGVDMVVQKGSLSLAEFGEELRAAIATKQPHVRLP